MVSQTRLTLFTLVIATLAWIPGPALANNLGEMCILNPDGTGQYKTSLDRRFILALTQARPNRFSIVQASDRCDDDIDNNCDGRLNEGCTQAPTIWQAGQDCEQCMAQTCSSWSKACKQDNDCQAAVACVAQHKCLDPYLGPLACICGEGISIAECQNTGSTEHRAGACAQHLEATPSMSLEAQAGKDFAHRTLTCMGLNCADACSEHFRR